MKRRKLLAFLLACAMGLTLAACGGESGSNGGGTPRGGGGAGKDTL